MGTTAGRGRNSDQVTVVIPTRDRVHRLRRTLNSALGQQEVDVEVVVVDDGSTDGTTEYLMGAAENDRRVRAVTHASSKGVAKARNSGIQAAAGEWVAFLDDDDVWSPHKLRRELDTMRTADAQWCYSAVVLADTRLRPFHICGSPVPEAALTLLLARQVIPCASSVIARADVVRRLGGFDEALDHLADWDLWIRLAATTVPARCPSALVAYVQHDGAMHVGSDIASAHAELDYVEAKHSEVRALHGVTFDRSSMSMWIASGHRSTSGPWRAHLRRMRIAIGRHNDRQQLRDARAWLREA